MVVVLSNRRSFKKRLWKVIIVDTEGGITEYNDVKSFSILNDGFLEIIFDKGIPQGDGFVTKAILKNSDYVRSFTYSEIEGSEKINYEFILELVILVTACLIFFSITLSFMSKYLR